jgi:hypothetical protein
MIGGVSYPPIPDRAFTEAVFGIWLGDQGSAHGAREKLVANLEPSPRRARGSAFRVHGRERARRTSRSTQTPSPGA